MSSEERWLSALGPLPCAEDVRRGSVEERREVERKAWARLVKATEMRWREDIQGAAQVDYLNEIDAARRALRDLGVDVDTLLEEP